MMVELIEEAGGDPTHSYDFKRLEQIWGFMCHLAMTYECVTPFLKGLHLTLASYLPHRDAEGWKLLDKQWLNMVEDLVQQGKMSREDADDAIEEEWMAQRPEAEWLSYV